mgnify:CR=1 FL=1
MKKGYRQNSICMALTISLMISMFLFIMKEDWNIAWIWVLSPLWIEVSIIVVVFLIGIGYSLHKHYKGL